MADNIEELFSSMGVDLNDKPNELMHYGIPGMRWGKRKGGGGGASSKSSPKLTVKSLTNEELKAGITRMKLEQEFIKLATPPPNAGKKAVKQMIANVAKTQAEAYLQKAATDGSELVKAAYLKSKGR